MLIILVNVLEICLEAVVIVIIIIIIIIIKLK